jgi:surface carbohydrate biosynthesis protein
MERFSFRRRESPEARTVVLVVDEAPRDFLGLVLLALHLVSAGLRVVISDRAFSDLVKVFPDAVFLGKAHIKNHRGSFANPTAFHPAEGGLFQEHGWADSVRYKHFLETLAVARPKAIFVWGEEQREVIRAYDTSLGQSVIVSGSQRLDLSIPKNHWLSNGTSVRLQKEFDDYVLITPRFTTLLNERPDAHLRTVLSRHDGAAQESIQLGRWAKDSADLGLFLRVVPRVLSDYPDQKFVLRPHPAENIKIYEGLLGRFPNVTISRAGNFIPWLLGAKMLLTCNSTSGVEGVLAHKPVINIRADAVGESDHDISIASEAGLLAHSVEETMRFVRNILTLDEEFSTQVWSDKSKARLANLSQEATPIIAKKLVSMADALPLCGPLPCGALDRLPRRSRRTDDYFERKLLSVSEEEVREILHESEFHGYPRIKIPYCGNGTVILESG